MATQKALVLLAEKEPYKLVSDWPIPTPGPTDVLVKVVVVALNPVDAALETYGGRFLGLAYPIVWGVDGAGVVEAVGSGVTRFVKGDRV